MCCMVYTKPDLFGKKEIISSAMVENSIISNFLITFENTGRKDTGL